MQSHEIRRRFLDFFAARQHAVRDSSALVPQDDPTLLFTNAGMVQFKRVFLGQEDPPEGNRRAVTAQKCVRAGGKHNDLEQVGHTARHHTFFEMLGNFSFGDYFKRDAIAFAWDFITKDLKIPIEHLRVTVYKDDDEARKLWQDVAGVEPGRIYGLGERDNFWQMADTGPCGPCSEIYVDLAAMAKDFRFPAGAKGEWTDVERTEFSTEGFVEGAEAGRFLEIWNLVFMQFDRQADGTLVPLPKPSVDTGAGLERIAAVMQGVTNNFHTDGFASYLAKVEEIVGIPYHGRSSDQHYAATVDGRSVMVDPASFRVLADHARAVSFLLADGVFPSNEGRGYVLRRILRRAVRHAWLMGRTAPTLAPVVEVVIATMRDVYPELHVRAKHIIDTTRQEEERFLATIDAGMARFEELAPEKSTQGSTGLRGTIAGEDAFTLYDRYGFPIDLTDLMARERGYTVDVAGFEASLDAQRQRSQADRKSKALAVTADELADLARWEKQGGSGDSQFVGYDMTEVPTTVAAVRFLDGNRVAVLLEETPFYAESGGQVSDHGEIVGTGWRVDVDDVRKFDGRHAAVGTLEGTLSFGAVVARVPAKRRKDTERNHTATHLLHAALRRHLGEGVHQAGSLVDPERLRFDFTHHGPVKGEILATIEREVNDEIWKATPVTTREMAQREAIAAGAMALFGEKYGDVVRVVGIGGYSMELCGGTHVRNTAEIGLFKVVTEGGVSAGVRRIEAVTGRSAYALMDSAVQAVKRVGELLRAPNLTSEQVPVRLEKLLEEKKQAERQRDDALRGGGGGDAMAKLLADAATVGGATVAAGAVSVPDAKTLQTVGDAVREKLASGVAVLGASFEDGKHTLLAVVSDDLIAKGVKADLVVRELATAIGGRGGGKPHMAQAGIPDGARLPEAYAAAAGVVARLLGG
jgi:alanyl-tRNA synthetase